MHTNTLHLNFLGILGQLILVLVFEAYVEKGLFYLFNLFLLKNINEETDAINSPKGRFPPFLPFLLISKKGVIIEDITLTMLHN